MKAGLTQIKKYLSQRCGTQDEEGSQLAANVVQYITSVWNGARPTTEMGVRNAKEMRTVGECLDALLRGDLATVGDMLMQRLKAIERAHKDGNWQTAAHLELCGDLDVGLATQEELQEAVRGRLTTEKLAADVKGKASGRKGPF